MDFVLENEFAITLKQNLHKSVETSVWFILWIICCIVYLYIFPLHLILLFAVKAAWVMMCVYSPQECSWTVTV